MSPVAKLVLGTLFVVAAMGCSDDPAEQAASTSSSQGTGGGQGGDNGVGAGGPGAGGNGAGVGGFGGSGGSGSQYQVCANPPAQYPAGPYGFQIGDTFEPLQLQGWTNPNPTARINTEPFENYTLDDLRAEHPSTFVVFHLSAFF